MFGGLFNKLGGAEAGGYVLKGRLITEAIEMRSVQSVLEDEKGDVVTIHMYNIPSLPATTSCGSGWTTIKDLEDAQKLFPKGQNLAIIEPFYKVMLDGTPGVRVDDPAEVVFLDVEGNPLKSAAEIEELDAAAPGWSRPVVMNPTVNMRVIKRRRPNKSKKGSKGKE